MPAYYNEHDPFAAAWLRELIAAGHIALGDVDERSIEDVHPAELVGYTQCHFFAGIGIWSLALRESGWPDDQPVWTGSCPCQPFSTAGKGGGFADQRHLWPAFFHLIQECRPVAVFGEQVASKDGLAWLDLVSADLEAAGYAVGAMDTCAAGFGAPHIRQRLYWVADANDRRQRLLQVGGATNTEAWGRSEADRLADASGTRREEQRRQWQQSPGSTPYGAASGMGNTVCAGLPMCECTACSPTDRQAGRSTQQSVGALHAQDPRPVNGLWRAADWLGCTDGKWRPVEPGSFPLADAGAFRNRVGLLRGAGNAVTLGQAQGFIESYLSI